MPISNAQELFIHELGEIYDAEQSVEEFLSKAMQGGEQQGQGLMDKAKDKLTG